MIKDEFVHSILPNLIQINNDVIFQLEFLPIMITRANSASSTIDHSIDEIVSNQSMVREKTPFKKFQTQTTANTFMNNTETTESTLHSEVRKNSPATSSSLTPGNNIILQVLVETLRTSPDLQNNPNLSELSASKDIPFDATNHQSHFLNIATLTFLQFSRTQRGMNISLKPVTEFKNQLQTNSTVTNQSNSCNDHTFMLIRLVVEGGVDQTRGPEDPPCTKISYSSKLVPRAAKGLPAIFYVRACSSNLLKYGIGF